MDIFAYKIGTVLGYYGCKIVPNNKLVDKACPEYYIQDISRTKLPFSRTKYTRFKGNRSRYVGKSISYLFNILSVIDIFMAQPPPHPFYLFDSPTFI